MTPVETNTARVPETTRTSSRWAFGIAIVLACPWIVGQGRAGTESTPTTLRYEAEAGAFVIHDGPHFNNRPLYGNHIDGFVLAGDRPFLRMAQNPYVDGCFLAAVIRHGHGKWLHDWNDVTAKYRNGRMEWIARDTSLPGLSVRLEAVPLSAGPGMALRATVEGSQPGDRLVWAFGGAMRLPPGAMQNVNWAWDVLGHPELLTRGFVADDCQGSTIRLAGDCFVLQPPAYAPSANLPRHIVAGRSSAAAQMVVADASAWTDPAVLPSRGAKDRPIVCGTVELAKNRQVVWAFAAGVGNEADLLARTAVPAAAFAAGRSRVESVARQVVVDTPDPRFNAAVAASCTAIDAVWYPPVFVHGAMQWNSRLPGWRTTFGGITYGWHSRVKDEAKFYIGHQIRESDKRLPKADPRLGYGQQAQDSRFHGRGRIAIDQSMYDMQSQFFDQILHDWRYTADPELEKLLRPALELHLDWMRDCFDPDGDGVYESYINTWPTDSQWYNGAGTAEETAYAYRGHKAARDLAIRAGDSKAAAFHRSQLEKIHKGFLEQLWIARKGYVGSYREQLGHRRLNEDAWLYSEFLPIDAELLTPLQAAQALYYSQWGLENERMPYGGRRVWTSNWVPSIWSVREMWPGDNYHLALAYFQTGLAEDGWDILRGTYLESMYASPVPGNLGHKVGGIDFNDCSSMFCRAVVEGVFGYTPDYPNGHVQIAPQFPAAWDRASIRSPDFTLKFQRWQATAQWDVELSRSAEFDLRLPLRAGKVTKVQANGRSVRWEVLPSFGQSLLRLRLPESKSARILVSFEASQPPLPAVTLTANVGEKIKWTAPAGRLLAVEDPQGVLADAAVHEGLLVGEVAKNPGHHTMFGRVCVGDLEQWQLFRLKITDREAEAAESAKKLREVPKAARWDCLDVSKTFNGDVREIFRQQYLSPRPQTCSARIGSDGYAPWTFYYWGYTAPTIGLEHAANLLKQRYTAFMAGPDPSLDMTDAVTLEAWVRADPMPNEGGRIIDKTEIGTLNGFLLDTYPGNSLRLLTANGMCTCDAKLSAGRWTHVAGVYSASKRIMKLYVDGKEAANVTGGDFPPLRPSPGPLRIGVDAQGGSRFLGGIRRVAVYRRALSAEELAQRCVAPKPLPGVVAEWVLDAPPKRVVPATAGTLALKRDGAAAGQIVVPQGVPFFWSGEKSNIAFTSQWDNWPTRISVPVRRKGEAIWFLVCGSSNPMQCGIANAEMRMHYADGVVEKLELIHPFNYWSLCPLRVNPTGPGQDSRGDYDYSRDGFCLPKIPPQTVQLGSNCRANLLNWRLRPGVELESVTLETLSQEVVVGLMGATLMNRK